MEYVIRKMTKEDCKEVTHLITISWNETYRNLIPDEFLDNMYLNEEERTNISYNKFNENDNHQYVLEVDHKIVGYINVGITDDIEYDNCGEIYAIYIINGYKGYGYGKTMLKVGIKELKSMNCDKMLIKCAVGNQTNDFYKYMGGKLIKQIMHERLHLPVNVYYFDKI